MDERNATASEITDPPGDPGETFVEHQLDHPWTMVGGDQEDDRLRLVVATEVGYRVVYVPLRLADDGDGGRDLKVGRVTVKALADDLKAREK